MRKVLFLCFSLLTLLGCQKEQTPEPVDFSVNLLNGNSIEKGINEDFKLHFEIFTKENLREKPLKYRIDGIGNYEANMKKGERKIISQLFFSDSDLLYEPELVIDYTGLREGVYILKVFFQNLKGQEIVKEIRIKIRKYKYNVEVINGKRVVNQGEEVDYDIEVVSENPNLPHYISFHKAGFLGYDLDKSIVKFNGEKIVLDKEYRIEDLSKIKVQLTHSSSGDKRILYTIKNKTFEDTQVISQYVKKNDIYIDELTSQVDKNKKIAYLTGKLRKSPKFSNKVFYKFKIIKGTFNSLEGKFNSLEEVKDWTEISLQENDKIKIPIKILKEFGQRPKEEVIIITFKDEFDNQTEITKGIDI